MNARSLMLLPAAVAIIVHMPAAGQSIGAAASQQVSPAPAPSPELTAQQERIARARANLIALREGRLAVSDLSATDLQGVLDLDRMLRGNTVDTRTPRQQCVDNEVRRAGGRPSRLAWSVIELKCR